MTTRQETYRILDPRGVYAATWRARPYTGWPSPDEVHDVYLQVMTGTGHERTGPWTFNYAVRRDPCFLASGDAPRFALMTNERETSLRPWLWTLGDLRIRLTVGDKACWLDERGTFDVTYHPWGTRHHVDLPEYGLTVDVDALLVATHGLAVEIRVTSDAACADDVTVTLCYGGLAKVGQNGTPEYLVALPEHEADDTIILDGVTAMLSDPTIPWAVRTEANAARAEVEVNPAHGVVNRVSYHYPDATTRSIRFLAAVVADGLPSIHLDDVECLREEALAHYQDLLDTVEIDTPDPILNTGLYTAVINLEYDYQAPAWLEGVHGWAAYWFNSYQISAAIALGQLDRAREALRFFGAHPGAQMNADGSLHSEAHDGLPYYLLQLHHYWRATGDRETLDVVWDPVCRQIERFLRDRDPDGDGLLDFHAACNVFMYQADHVSLPGAAFSPSVMMAGMLERMAELAEVQGDPERAANWRRRAAYVHGELLRRMWLPDEGRFTACIDPWGTVQRAAYYTDYVFPELYSTLPREYAWHSLSALDRDLWVGDDLMRVGNYMPELFGNSLVHFGQSAEAAEAYCRAGRLDRGYALLHGAARASTVLTDSPGAVPEHGAFDGRGLTNFLFGNPIGALIRGIIAGLFGVERAAAHLPMTWQPAIPTDWNQARLRLPGIDVSIAGRHGHRTYHLTVPVAQALTCRIPLLDHVVDQVIDADGQAVSYRLDPHPSGAFLVVECPTAREHAIVVTSHPAAALPLADRVEPKQAMRTVTPPLMLNGVRTPLDLTTHYNAADLPFINRWRHDREAFDLTPLLDTDGVTVQVGPYTFTPQAQGENFLLLWQGFLTHDNRLDLPVEPHEETLPIGAIIRGLEFLWAAEGRVRLTNMPVGTITLAYTDGSLQHAPLIYGRNLDCAVLPFATDVVTRRLPRNPHGDKAIAAWALAADPDRVLDRVHISIDLPDIALGIFAINLVT